MKPKMAQRIHFFLCDNCHAVHIGMERNGKMFAEAIPVDIDAVAESLAETITESRRRQAGAPAQKH